MTTETSTAVPPNEGEEAVDFVAVIDENGNIAVEPKATIPEPSPAQTAEPPKPANTWTPPASDPEPEDADETNLTPEEKAVLKQKTKDRIQTLARRVKANDQQLSAERERRIAAEREAAELREQTAAYASQSVDASESLVGAKINAATTKYMQAREVGDAKAEAEAVNELAQAQAQKMAIDAYKRQRPAEAAPAAQTPVPARPAQAVIVENPRAHQATAEWIEKNGSWFGKDPVLTQATKAIHEQLLVNEGFRPDLDDPDLGYPAYFAEIDKRLKEYFPQKFNTPAPQPKGQQVVTTPSRTPTPVSSTPTASNKIKVQLSQRQINWAKENGVPLETMIKEQARLQAGQRRN